MIVSELAKITGVSADRLRHYEEIGLLSASRTDSGYRIFSAEAKREVHFIAKCREIGVPLKKIRELIPLYRARTLTFDDMIELMSDQMAQVDREILVLQNRRKELTRASAWFRKRKSVTANGQ